MPHTHIHTRIHEQNSWESYYRAEHVAHQIRLSWVYFIWTCIGAIGEYDTAFNPCQQIFTNFMLLLCTVHHTPTARHLKRTRERTNRTIQLLLCFLFNFFFQFYWNCSEAKAETVWCVWSDWIAYIADKSNSMIRTWRKRSRYIYCLVPLANFGGMYSMLYGNWWASRDGTAEVCIWYYWICWR